LNGTQSVVVSKSIFIFTIHIVFQVKDYANAGNHFNIFNFPIDYYIRLNIYWGSNYLIVLNFDIHFESCNFKSLMYCYDYVLYLMVFIIIVP
jgi:hypothetical protein